MKPPVPRPASGAGTAALLCLAALLYLGPDGLPGADAWGLGETSPNARAPHALVVALVVFAAAALSSVVGFAFSAIAGATVLHFVPSVVQSVQILMIASIGIQGYSVARLVPAIRWSRCLPFVAGGLTTLPLGTALLAILPPRVYLLTIGVGLVAYGLYLLLRRPLQVQGARSAADVLVGAIGGITGPLGALPGVPVTIWCGMRSWSKLEQRAVYQPYILVMQLAGLGAVSMTQAAPAFDPLQLGYALPALAGATVGLRMFNALTDRQFERLINVALIASGIALMVK